MGGSRATTLILGKVGYVGACLTAAVVLVAGGYAHGIVSATTALEGGASLGGNVSPAAAQNILVMGLESRTNFQGQCLSAAQLTQTHSGKASNICQGSQDTDTLMLIHVFAGGKQAVGYSVPRDDVVNFPTEVDPNNTGAETEGKIDAAYAYAYGQYITQNVGKLGTTPALYTGANQAGELFQVQTVESVTGVHIDHFVVSNIEGFLLLSEQFGGIEVCLKAAPQSIEPAGAGFKGGSNLVDLPYGGAPLRLSNSGFDAFKDGYNENDHNPQYLHLQPAQALAFVRARDSLPGIDIGRTHRQQAAIDYLIYNLKHRSVLSDPTLIQGMLNSAKSYLQTDQGFDLLGFAPQMQSLTGSHLKLTTLADAATQNVTIPGYPGAQSANYIYVPNLRQTVNAEFYGGAAVQATKSVTVDVYNGSGTSGLAGGALTSFAAMGYTAGKSGNSSAQTQTLTADSQVFYGSGAENNADSIAAMIGAQAATSVSSLPAGHVEVLLGQQVTDLPAGLETFGATSVTQSQFMTAAGQDNLPATEIPPAGTGAAAGTGGTAQSLSATEIGPRAATPAQAAQAQAAASEQQTTNTEVMSMLTSMATSGSGSSGSSSNADPTVPANARYGIPCVY